MKTFNEFMIEKEENKDFYPEGVYISVDVSKDSIDRIHEYMDVHLKDLECNRDEIHTTVIFSKKSHKEEIKPKSYTAKGTSKGFAIFGKENDTLVIEIDSPELVARNQELVNQYDFVSDFDEYKVHLSLSYKAKDFDISKLPDFDFDIEFKNETVEQLDLDWSN